MGCGATKIAVKEEPVVLSSEDKTEECKFFCPLCMLFYERTPPPRHKSHWSKVIIFQWEITR